MLLTLWRSQKVLLLVRCEQFENEIMTEIGNGVFRAYMEADLHEKKNIKKKIQMRSVDLKPWSLGKKF